MADGIPPVGTDAGSEPPAPPPLDAIRVKGAGARGINKRAILFAAGTGVAAVLLLASGAFTNTQARKPAETKPLMSDPARPEMARDRLRDLPTDYTKVAPIVPPAGPAGPPVLGPPLPGDVAAFAEPDAGWRGHTGSGNGTWSDPEGSGLAAPPDAAEIERDEAIRSGLFFALRDDARAAAQQDIAASISQPPPQGVMTAFAPPAPTPSPERDRPDRVLFPGSVIAASLITELNSESPGAVIAQVTQAVFDSATGRMLLIPQGARLIGDYKSSTRYGQGRVAIIWSRLIMPDGEEVSLEAPSTDPSGAAGVSGDVDNHLADVFGAAALGTLINIGVATTQEPQLTYGGLGLTTRDPVDAAIADGVQRSASTVTNRVVDRGLAIPPTIRVQAGARISVIVTRRMHLQP